MMDRVNSILFHPLYQQHLQNLQSLEVDRKFCGHSIDHFLAVARLSFFMAQEADVKVNKEVIYATALLHDIGRYLEYTDGTPHHEGSVIIAREILPECGFEIEETEVILQVIKGHRGKLNEGNRELSKQDDFTAIFYRADKLSRNCFACPAISECNWSDEKKNMRVTL